MKAFVLAAGLGTRLRPFTLKHPKALVEVGGRPMLGRVLDRLEEEGFDRIAVNIHHFGEQIIDYLESPDQKRRSVAVSDERDELLDTGGAILHARAILGADDEPFLVHNVDILSDAPLRQLAARHIVEENDVTMLVSDRESGRKLIFDSEGFLTGWHHLGEDRFKPADYRKMEGDEEYAFSGIHMMSPSVFAEMERQQRGGAFSVIDFLLEARGHLRIRAYVVKGLQLIDIGKPATLSQANLLISGENDG